MNHKALCLLGARYAKTHGFDRIIIEPGFRKEQPDVFAFNKTGSVLIECKVSRSDFLADKKKPFREDPKLGVGKWRYYLVAEGVATQEDMPPGWLLLIAKDENTIEVPFPDLEGIRLLTNEGKKYTFSERNTDAELSLMWSWEYRREHKILPEIPTTPIVFKHTAREIAQEYLAKHGEWAFWLKYYGEEKVIENMKLAIRENIAVPEEIYEKYKTRLTDEM